MTSQGHLLTCHAATHAIAVGANQNWPCTDMHLWYGSIQPGKTVTRTGHVVIAKADLEAFVRHEGTLIRTWQEDTGKSLGEKSTTPTERTIQP